MSNAMKSKEKTSDTNQLIRQRQQKVNALREAGHNPYRNDFQPDHTSAAIRERFASCKPAEEQGEPTPLSDDRFRLAGRIVEHRSFGKAAFIKLADRGGRLQVYVRRDKVGDEAYAVFKKAENWDFVGVTGFAFFTKTGELTLMAESVVLLTKAVRPPPEKWSGLKDHETRYRQRYVDLVANPEVAQVFRERAAIIRYIREFFDRREFLEVETPLLHMTLGGAAARPFRTQHNALGLPLYLRIALELHLKRLIVGGFERVYEIGRVLRNEGLSRFHNPEFTMLEFYMAYATYDSLMTLTEELLTGLVSNLKGSERLTYQGREIDFQRPYQRVSVVEAVLAATVEMTPALTREVLLDAAAFGEWLDASGLLARKDGLGEGLRVRDGHGARIAWLFDQIGEAKLPQDRPCFVTDYPAETSPLSRRKDDDPNFVDRFELFVAGTEVANAFSELNDPADQRQRFVEQVEAAKRGDQEAMEHDEDYCRALEYGMPPTGGEGIGIDRLVMLLCDQPSIRDVLLFPLMRPEG